MNAQHWFLVVFAMLLAPAAYGQEPPTAHNVGEEPAPVEEPKLEPATPTPTPAVTAPAVTLTLDPPPAVAGPQPTAADQMLYLEAFELLASNDRVGARQKLRELYETYPDSELADQAVKIYAMLEAKTKPSEPERSTGLTRAEFITFQTAHGIAVGAEFCVLFECNGQGTVAMMIAGAGLGLGLSLWVSHDGIEEGRVQAIDTGVLWGAWQAAALIGLGTIDDSRTAAGALIGFQMAGLGAGEVLYRLFMPSAGQVSMASSTGVWSGALTAMMFGATGYSGDGKVVLGTVLAVSDIGLIVGGALASNFPMSRGRVLVVDSGGILGALVGLGIPIIVGGDNIEPQPILGGMLLGTVAGLGLSTYLTRGWDAEKSALNLPDINMGLQPTKDGFVLSLGGVL